MGGEICSVEPAPSCEGVAEGVGASAARILFGTFPGAWEIRVRQSNEAALEFWSRVVEEWSGRAVTSARVCFGGVDWNVLRIEAER